MPQRPEPWRLARGAGLMTVPLTLGVGEGLRALGPPEETWRTCGEGGRGKGVLQCNF